VTLYSTPILTILSKHPHDASASSRALASFRSSVSKPSVSQSLRPTEARVTRATVTFYQFPYLSSASALFFAALDRGR
jgi:hypothetical protein